MSDDRGCCEGDPSSGPEAIENPPGQPTLSYRVGTHGTFLSAMLARLSALRAAADVAPGGQGAAGDGCLGESHVTFLPGGEPEAATALLDGWACVADVLTFYQERIANEGYLRTATERRSVVELGRLTGYEPRPGVAASVRLAFTVQESFDGEVPARTKVQSVPRPGQAAQTFETTEPLIARAQWNALPARAQARGLFIRRETYKTQPTGRIEIFLKGIDQNVHAGDVVVLQESSSESELLSIYRVAASRPDVARDQTTLRMVLFDGLNYPESWSDAPAPFNLGAVTTAMKPARATVAAPPTRSLEERFIGGDSAHLFSEPDRDGEPEGDGEPDREGEPEQRWRRAVAYLRSRPGLLSLLAYDSPALRDSLAAALRGAPAPEQPGAYVLRATAQVFGHNAPLRMTVTTSEDSGVPVTTTYDEWEAAADEDVDGDVMFLDGDFPTIRAGDHVVVRSIFGPTDADFRTKLIRVDGVSVRSRYAYGLSGKTTRLELGAPWWAPVEGETRNKIAAIRSALVYVQSEPIALVGEPIQADVSGSFIDVEGIIDGLEAGRWLIVEGERAVQGASGVASAELARVAYAETRTTEDATGDDGAPVPTAPFTRIHLVEPLSSAYARASVVVRGNVARATHGETRDEVLGSGDASVPSQRFELRQPPRTWVSAPTPSGVASTLEVRASGVLWPEARSPTGLGPRDEVVVTRTTGEGRDEVMGGDGHRGARFPTGVENLTARYRAGLGAAGNVGAGLITTLVTRPMGVQDVKNPLRASGGADPDGRDEIRERIPIAARAIDRLVSVQDHADFALNSAGVDKASAWLGADPHGGATVTVVIAGDEDVPIDETSDLFVNLREAFRRYGDPSTRLHLKVAQGVPLALQARVGLDPRYTWSRVEPALREALYARQGWAARSIGEPAWRSRVMDVMQSVAGVRSVDIDVFGPMYSEEIAPPAPSAGGAARAIDPNLVRRFWGLVTRLKEARGGPVWSFAAARDQVLYFARSLPDAVSLQEVTP
ncbi:baseplate J/gp47 family protein [Sorangium sp. So ce296]|uniref:baseplate J/gp47 family protein n=1 Tax=Sorangium sp. So ce296 TaxID=3133296 RepID=UPI003F62ABC6